MAFCNHILVRRLLCVGLFVLAITGASNRLARGQSEISPQIWVDYNPIIPLSEKSERRGDVGLRWELESNGWWRFILRPGYRYTPKVGTFLMAGVGSFYTRNEALPNEWEIRPFQGVATTWPQGSWVSFQHYVRLEERIDVYSGEADTRVSLRFRYRLRAFHRFGAFMTHGSWMLYSSAELFATLAGNQGQFQELVRLVLGVEHTYGRLRGRVDVTWQLREQGIVLFGGDVSDVFIRFRLFHTFGR